MRVRWLLVVASLATVLLGAVPAAGAGGGTVSGTGEHDPGLVEFFDSTGPSVTTSTETVENTVELSFPVEGGAFEGTGRIVYRHNVTWHNEPDPCTGVVTTTIVIRYEGTFDPANNNMFIGTYVPVSQESVQDPVTCPENLFEFKIDENENPWSAQLDPRTGHISEIEGRFLVTVDVDPAAVAVLLEGDGLGDLTLAEAIGLIEVGTAPTPAHLTFDTVGVFDHPGGCGVVIGFGDPWPTGFGSPGSPIDDFVLGFQAPGFSGGLGVFDGEPITVGDPFTEPPEVTEDGQVIVFLPLTPEELIAAGGTSMFGSGVTDNHDTFDDDDLLDAPPPEITPSQPLIDALDDWQAGTTQTPTTTTTAAGAGGDTGSTDEPTDSEVAGGIEEGGGGFPPWLIGLVVIAGGGIAGWFFLARKDDCRRLYREWKEFERQCEEAREGLKNAQRELAESGDDIWESSVEEWQGMVDDFCARAEEARQRYEECVEERDALPEPPPEPVEEPPPLEPVQPFTPGPAEGEEEPPEEEPVPVETPAPPVRTRARGCDESDPPRQKNKRTTKVTIPAVFQPVLIGGDFHQAEVDSLGIVEELRQVEIVSNAVAKALLLAPGAQNAEEFQVGVDPSVVAAGVKFAANYARVLTAGAAAIIEKWMDYYGDMPDNEVMITWKRIPYRLTCVEIWVCRDGRWVHDRNRFTVERTGKGRSVRTRLKSGMSHSQAMQHINTYGAKFKAELERALKQYDEFAEGCAGR